LLRDGRALERRVSDVSGGEGKDPVPFARGGAGPPIPSPGRRMGKGTVLLVTLAKKKLSRGKRGGKVKSNRPGRQKERRPVAPQTMKKKGGRAGLSYIQNEK